MRARPCRWKGEPDIVKVLVTGSAVISAPSSAQCSWSTGTKSSVSTPATTTAATSARTSRSAAAGVDVRDVRPQHLEGFDAVVHLAALSNDPLGELSRELTYEINHHGTLLLARAAKSAGVRRFVFASSCSMYGAADGDAVLAEDAPLRPLTPYAESKVRSEEALRELDCDGFTTVSMRNATVYGVSPRLRLDIVLNNLAAWSHVTGRIRLLSDGMSWRPLLHVRDLAKVALRMVEAPAALVAGKRVQHRLGRAELPRSRPRGDPRRGDGLRGRVRGRRFAGPALVPRRLLGARGAPFPTSTSTGTPGGAPRSWSTPTGRSG